MPEAFGTVLLKASSEIMADIEGCGESVGYENIESLLQEAGVDPASVDISSYDNFSVEDDVVIEKGFLVITIFGTEWMACLNALLRQGVNIEAYGHIQDEFGAEGYYALTQTGKRYFQLLDSESGEVQPEPEQVRKEWLTFIPQELIEIFN
ncbi:MAG: hypothetical protein ACPHXV_04775 [Glaciecola sp.]